jgi:hypothetical protein
MFLKRSFVIALGLIMVMFLAACGSNGTTGSGPYGSGSTNPPATTAPSTGGSSSSAVIQTATKSSITVIRSTPSQETLPPIRPVVRALPACGSWPHPIWLCKAADRRVVVTGIRIPPYGLATFVCCYRCRGSVQWL